MTQLIPQQKIDEAAIEYAVNALPNGTGVLQSMIAEVYSTGVKFALNEIQHLMVEFVIYCDDNYEEGRTNFQQLLEEFINDKNTKK